MPQEYEPESVEVRDEQLLLPLDLSSVIEMEPVLSPDQIAINTELAEAQARRDERRETQAVLYRQAVMMFGRPTLTQRFTTRFK